jgi:hypothetical protein
MVSPLLVALLKGHPDVVRLLLEAGASRSQLAAWCSAALDDDPRAYVFARVNPFRAFPAHMSSSSLGKFVDRGEMTNHLLPMLQARYCSPHDANCR